MKLVRDAKTPKLTEPVICNYVETRDIYQDECLIEKINLKIESLFARETIDEIMKCCTRVASVNKLYF